MQRLSTQKSQRDILTQDVLVPIFYVLVLTGFAFISFLPGLLRVNTRSVTVPFRALVVAFALLIILRSLSSKVIVRGWTVRFFGLFWIIYLIRMLSDTYLFPVSLGRPRNEFWLFGLGITMLPAVALLSRLSITGSRRASRSLYIALIMVSFLSILNFSNAFEDGRLSGNLVTNAIELGHLGASLSIISAWFFVDRSRDVSISRAVLLITMVLGLTITILAGSRGPILGLIVVAVIMFLYSTEARSKLRIIVILALVAVIIPLLVTMTLDLGGSLLGRIEYLRDYDNFQNDRRIILWSEAWRLYLENPILGSSLDIPGMGYPHNIIIEGFMATGTFGGLLLVAIVISGSRAMLRLVSTGSPAAWIGLLFIQYLVGALFSGTLYDDSQFWYLYAGVIAASQMVIADSVVLGKENF